MKKRFLLVSALSAFLLTLSACDIGIVPTSSALYPDSSGTSQTTPEESSAQPEQSSNSGEQSSSDVNSSSSDASSSSDIPAVTTYTISFDKNGGTGNMDNVTKNKDEKYTLPECGFTAPSGKQFKTWSIDNTERAKGYELTVTADTTVKAIWEDIPPVDTSFVITMEEAPTAGRTILGYASPKEGDDFLPVTAKVDGKKVTVDFGANPGETYEGFHIIELKEGKTEFGEENANIERVSEYITSFADGSSKWYFHVWFTSLSSSAPVEMTKSEENYVLNNQHLDRGLLFAGVNDYGYKHELIDYTALDNSSTAKEYLTYEDFDPHQYFKLTRGGKFNITVTGSSIKVDLVELDPTAVTVTINEPLKDNEHKVFVEGWDNDNLTPNLYAEATVNGTSVSFDLGEAFFGLTGYQLVELRDGVTSYDGSDYSTKVLRPTISSDTYHTDLHWDETFKVHYKSIENGEWSDYELNADELEAGWYLSEPVSFKEGDIFCVCVDNHWLDWNNRDPLRMPGDDFVKDGDSNNIKFNKEIGSYIIHASTTGFYLVDTQELSAVYKVVINGDQAGAITLTNKQGAISVTSGDRISIYRNEVLQETISLKDGENNLHKISDGVFEVIATTEPVGENKNLILNHEGLFLGGYAEDNNFYLRGDMNAWKSLNEYKFTKGTKEGLEEGNGVDAQKDGKDQYFIKNLVIDSSSEFKGFSFKTYYPGNGNNLNLSEPGTYDIYFVPEGGITSWNSYDDRGYFWVYKHPVVTGITANYTGSNVVTGGHIVGGVSLHLTYDKDLDPAVLAPDADGVLYSINGGAFITYSELLATTLELSDPELNNEQVVVTVKYLEYAPQNFNVVVMKHSNLFATVAIKNQDSSADVESANMFVGDTLKLSALTTLAGEGPVTDSLIWSSSNDAVVSVDEEGLLTAHAAGGPVTITLASYSGNAEPDTCSITVVVHTYYTAKINGAGDPISFDDLGNGSWVSHEPVTFAAGNKLTIYYEGDAQTFTAEETDQDHNNLHPTNGIYTPGACLVYLTPTTGTNGTIWVKGYARIVYNGVSYAAEHKFEQNGTDETYYITVNAVHGQTVTAGYIGGASPIELSLDNGYGNNLKVVEDILSIITTAENTKIYMHDVVGHSVWADNYSANITVNGTEPAKAMQHTQDAPEGSEDQYYKQISVEAGDIITFYDNGYQIPVSVVTGNAELVDGKVTILADCATADLYLKAYSDGTYRLWVSGLNGYYLRSKTGAFDANKHLIDTGEQEDGHTKYVIKNVILAENDKINFFRDGGFVMATDYTVTALKAGTYDIYFVAEGGVEGWTEATGNYFSLDEKTLTAVYSGENLVVNEGIINIANIVAKLNASVSGEETVEDNSALRLYVSSVEINPATYTFSSTGSKTVEIRYLGLSANMTVTVVAAPVHTTAITIQKGGVDCDSATVYTGTTLTLTAILTPNDSTDPVTWTTSDDSVVTVSNGVLTPVGVGSATITATSNGKQATCAITVKTGGYYVTYTNNDDEQVVLLLENAGEDGSGKTQYHGAISAKTGSILTFNYNYTSIVASKESGANIDDSEGFVVAYGGPSLGLYLKDQLAGNYSLWLDAPVFTVKVDGEVYSTTSRGDVGDNKAIFDISLTSGQKVRINYGYKELQVGNDSEVLEYTASSDGNYIFYINGTYQIWPNTTTNTVVHLIFDFSALSSYSPTCTNHKIHAWTSSGDVHTWASSDELINNNQYTLDYSGTISGLIIMFNQDTQLVKSYDVTPANASYTFEHGGTYRITVNPSGEWYMDNTTKVFPAGITVTKI